MHTSVVVINAAVWGNFCPIQREIQNAPEQTVLFVNNPNTDD